MFHRLRTSRPKFSEDLSQIVRFAIRRPHLRVCKQVCHTLEIPSSMSSGYRWTRAAIAAYSSARPG